MADLWARSWQLTPNNKEPTNLQAIRLYNEWRKAMSGILALGVRIMDNDDHHLVACRRALDVGWPTIIQPVAIAEGESTLSPTPQGRKRRAQSATPVHEEAVSGLSPGYRTS